jgi:hypothetical protein
MKRIFTVIFMFVMTSAFCQTWNGSSTTTTTSGYNTSIQLTHLGWGSHHALLFNAFKSLTEVNGDLRAYGNTKHQYDIGPYGSGAGAIMFLGNGGGFDFLLSGNSTGAGQNIDWGVPKMSIIRSGNVGIGNENPAYRLDVTGPANDFKARFQGPDGYITIGPANSSWAHIYTDRPNFIFNQNVWSIPGGFSSYNTSDLTLQTHGTTRVTVHNGTGNVGIGTSSMPEKLTVNGKIMAEEVKVVVDVPSDFVFAKNYALLPLTEVESYVNTNSHLPNLPSAAEIKASGWQVGEMSNKMLEKIEELTLYIIQQNKDIKLLQQQNAEMNKELEKLKR